MLIYIPQYNNDTWTYLIAASQNLSYIMPGYCMLKQRGVKQTLSTKLMFKTEEAVKYFIADMEYDISDMYSESDVWPNIRNANKKITKYTKNAILRRQNGKNQSRQID